ncbi:MAG TPA: 50S ribosomal protein L23 [Thermodesulfobacteriota bacterium]|nr:50S ribosomal protein L23 [Deltaproteobacteria bacterium]HNR14037.1 50S ribosomal protein L23 [Thermodesulfobacteriota bacterium]HNU70647.1 50S ribosomal protein L23 [Thermodesulfobacteriota bacterium]HQO77032.1 50S ribosomal protein L23 [Thermodesulfobacteriota bacterium]
MKNVYQVIKRPLITEKTTLQKEASNQVSFEVDRRANKVEIKQAVEKLFKVKVVDVATMMVPGKLKRMGRFTGQQSDWKKAIVTLKEGEKLPFLEGA